MGRPPIGKIAMSSTERSRRRRARLRASKPIPAGVDVKRLEDVLLAVRGKLEAALAERDREIARLRAELEQEKRRRVEDDKLLAGTALSSTGPARRRTAADWAALKAQVAAERKAKLEARRAAIAADGAEVVKLRKEVEELRGERTGLKQALRRVAKERDRNAVIHSSPLLRAAADGRLKRATYRKIIKPLHSDSRKHATEAEKDEAARLFIELEKLFQF